MDDIGVILILLSMFGFLIGVIGLIKGGIRMLRITSREQAGLLTLTCFMLFFVGGAIVGDGATETPLQVEQAQAEKVQVEQAQTAGAQDAKEQEKEAGEATGNSPQPRDGTESEKRLNTKANQDSSDTLPVVTTKDVLGRMEVHFVDVGQADCILIKADTGEAMLIDAGNNADANLVTSYIKKQGISKLDAVVGTHPHEDHIGGMDAVIDTFDIGKVYMPRVNHTSKTYEDVLTSIKNKGLKITTPSAGTTFNIGDAKYTVMAPNSSKYSNLNNYSIVLKMEYGGTAFLFTGDAEDISEQEMINKNLGLSADVLKVGHHGSDSSTTQAFLDKVDPDYAVIMVGKDNSYGHPNTTVMNRLNAKGVEVYRTDENGTIVATSDGTNITFSTQPGTYTSGSESGRYTTPVATPIIPEPDEPTPVKADDDRIVYWTPNGKSYHYTDKCPTLSRSKTILSGVLSQSPKDDPCGRCTK